MKLIALEAPLRGAQAASTELLLAEARRVWDLNQAGFVREIYFRADRPAAVLVLECTDVEEARGVLSTLPLVQSGKIEFELIPLIPYPGFQRLFKLEAG